MSDQSNTMVIDYLDDKIITELVKNENIRIRSAVFARQRKVVSRYFGIPLKHAGHTVETDLSTFIQIQGDTITYMQPNTPFTKSGLNISFGVGGRAPRQGWKIPSILYVTEKHVIIAPSASQLGATKTIQTIQAIVMLIFLLPIILFSFFFGPLFLLIAALCIAYPLLLLHSFFFRKSYLTVAPIDTIRSVNVAHKTIIIDGIFNTGIPSYLKYSVSAELYVGNNIILFKDLL